MCARFRTRLVLAVALSAGLNACQTPDPVVDQTKWNFTGANNANLATMIDDPMDLVHGQSDRQVSGLAAALPVMRLRRDQVKQLQSTDTTQAIGSGGGGSGGQSGGVPAEVQ